VQNAVMQARVDMNKELEKLILFIVSFKVHIQSGLEDYEKLIATEWKKQQEFDGNNNL